VAEGLEGGSHLPQRNRMLDHPQPGTHNSGSSVRGTEVIEDDGLI
jgi:hypothetical protein